MSIDDILPEVYTFGMSDYAVINLKTDPKLKADATLTANKLGVSLSAVLNNELRRFATEQRVVFEVPEVPNAATAKQLVMSKKALASGNYHQFGSTQDALNFLAAEL